MNVPEKIMNSIIMSMSTHLEPAALSILKDVLIKNLSHYTITECETLPATADDSNEYILKQKEDSHQLPSLIHITCCTGATLACKLTKSINPDFFTSFCCNVAVILFGKLIIHVERVCMIFKCTDLYSVMTGPELNEYIIALGF